MYKRIIVNLFLLFVELTFYSGIRTGIQDILKQNFESWI
jgi:hypothetical protein